MAFISIEKKYAVPKKNEATQDGVVKIAFSSPIKRLSYEELSKKLIFLYTEGPPTRILNHDSSRVLRQIEKDREVLNRPREEDIQPARRRNSRRLQSEPG